MTNKTLLDHIRPYRRPRHLSGRTNSALTIGAAHITYGWIECGETSFAIIGLCCTTTLIGFQWRFGQTKPWLSLWLAIWFSFHLFGMRFGLYDHSSVFDKAMHAIITCGFVVMWIAWTRDALVGSPLHPEKSRWGLFVSALLFALATAALWEIFEFTVDLTGLFQAQKGLEDTMLDMIAALAGGCLAWAWVTLTGVFQATSHPSKSRTFGPLASKSPPP